MSIRASVRFSFLRAKLRANMLRLASRVGRFLFIRRFYETLPTTEEHSVDVTKPRTDEAASADSQFARSDKPLGHTAEAGEAHAVSLSRPDLVDDSATTDDDTRAFIKPRRDTAGATERMQPWTLNRAFYEMQDYAPFYFAEDYLAPNGPRAGDQFDRQVAFIRSYTDSSSAAETHAVSLSRPDLVDDSATTDDDTRAFAKARSDDGGLTDTYLWSLDKPLSNALEAVETSTVSLSRPDVADGSGVAESSSWLAEKPFSEVSGVADTFQPWSLFKALGDNCTSCDEFAGQSIALDNDVQSIGKVLATRAGTTEQSFYGLERSTADPASVASKSAYALNRPDLVDSANGADITQKRFERAFTETRDYVEPGYSEDDYALDSPRAAESSVFTFGGVAADTTGAASMSFYALNRPDLADTLSVAESRASDLTRLVIDAGAATSVKTIDLAKPESDNPALADTGELVNQGYVNSFYFAEDYVGVRQTI